MNPPTAMRAEQWIHDQGAFPAITWTPNYTIRQINNGAADAIWAKAANYFKTYPFPIMLRTFAEFDGPWFIRLRLQRRLLPATEFKNAWQRMVNIFRTNGATNVGFWWTPQEGGVFAGSGGGTTSRNMLVNIIPATPTLTGSVRTSTTSPSLGAPTNTPRRCTRVGLRSAKSSTTQV